MKPDSVPSYVGPTNVDLQAIAAILVDLVKGAMQGYRFEKSGIDDVLHELAQNVPTHGDKAAIAPAVYARVLECTDNITKIREARVVVDKLAEVLEESEAHYVHEREGHISILADGVRSSARRMGDSIRAVFEKTLKYTSQIADKAAKTRRKNAEAGAEGDAAETPQAPAAETLPS
jgi:hypothetical protein